MQRITITTKQGRVAARVIARDEIQKIAEPILQMWNNRGGGKWRQAYLETFDEAQRSIIRTYHIKMRRWETPAGYPLQVRMTETTYRTLLSASRFFAAIPDDPVVID